MAPVDQELQQRIAQAAQQAAQPEPAKPVHLTINGQNYNFTNPQEASTFVESNITGLWGENQQLKQQMAEMQRRVEATQQTQQAAQQQQVAAERERRRLIEKEPWQAKLVEDPETAMRQAMGRILTGRDDINDPAPLILEMAARIQSMDQDLTFEKLSRRNPEFVDSPEARQHLDRVRSQIGAGQNLMGYQAALAMVNQEMQRRQQWEAAQRQRQGQQPQQNVYQFPQQQPPQQQQWNQPMPFGAPNLGRPGGGGMPNPTEQQYLEMFNNLPLEEQQKLAYPESKVG